VLRLSHIHNPSPRPKANRDLQTEIDGRKEAQNAAKQARTALEQARAESSASARSSEQRQASMEADMQHARGKLQRAKEEFQKVQVAMEQSAGQALQLERKTNAAEEAARAAKAESREVAARLAEAKRRADRAEEETKRKTEEATRTEARPPPPRDDRLLRYLASRVCCYQATVSQLRDDFEARMQRAAQQSERTLQTALDSAGSVTHEADGHIEAIQAAAEHERLRLEAHITQLTQEAARRALEARAAVEEAQELAARDRASLTQQLADRSDAIDSMERKLSGLLRQRGTTIILYFTSILPLFYLYSTSISPLFHPYSSDTSASVSASGEAQRQLTEAAEERFRAEEKR